VQALAVFSFDMPPGAVYAYSLGVQRELPWASVVEVNYVGNQGRHLTHRRDINFVLPEVALLRNASGAFVNANVDTVRQFLGYSAIRMQENTGVSSYNSLQVSWQKRLTRGFTSSVAYTWGKARQPRVNFAGERLRGQPRSGGRLARRRGRAVA
jgi:hypothetical protein